MLIRLTYDEHSDDTLNVHVVIDGTDVGTLTLGKAFYPIFADMLAEGARLYTNTNVIYLAPNAIGFMD